MEDMELDGIEVGVDPNRMVLPLQTARPKLPVARLTLSLNVLRVQQELGGIAAVGCSGVEVPGSGSSQRLGEKVGLRTGQPTQVWDANTMSKGRAHKQHDPDETPISIR